MREVCVGVCGVCRCVDKDTGRHRHIPIYSVNNRRKSGMCPYCVARPVYLILPLCMYEVAKCLR